MRKDVVLTHSNKDSSILYQESSNLPDFLGYMLVVIREGLWSWIWYAIIIKIFSKDCNLVLLKKEGGIIGGFLVTSFPLIKYKPYGWFNKPVKTKVEELMSMGYKYSSCLVIKKPFRNGLGKGLLKTYFEINKTKVYFTSAPKARKFYQRNGATIFFASKHDIFTFN